jgi:opacity protein-like surface antigen
MIMKRMTTVLTLMCVLSLASTGWAEEKTPPPEDAGHPTKLHGVGVKVHGSLATGTYEESDINDVVDSKFGYGFGLQAVVEFHPLLALQPELFFMNKGNSYSTANPSTKVTVSTNYIQVPILIALQLPLPVVKPRLLVGPHMSYFLGGTRTSDQTIGGKESSSSIELDSGDISSFDFGVTAGVGLDIELSDYVLTLDVRYETGFLDANGGADNQLSFTHNSTSANVGILYTF